MKIDRCAARRARTGSRRPPGACSSGSRRRTSRGVRIPKSMSLGQLALHVATMPGNVAELAALDTMPEPPAFIQPEATSAAELVPALTESVAKAQTGLGGSTMRR